jgi:hypothetical protein
MRLESFEPRLVLSTLPVHTPLQASPGDAGAEVGKGNGGGGGGGGATLSSISVSANGQTLSSKRGGLNVTSNSQVLTVEGLDQYGNILATQPSFNWSVTSEPSGASTSFSTSGSNTTVTFNEAGSYGLTVLATGTSVSTSVSLKVIQTASSISVTPGMPTLAEGATQQFAAVELDQFHAVLASQPGFTWSAGSGAITTGGLYTAPNSLGSFTVSASAGSLTGTTTATVVTGTDGMQNAFIGNLLLSLDADGSISRNDMIQIFQSVSANGAVTSSEFADLVTILNEAGTLNMPGFVQVLSSDVIKGNVANATYQGQALGNLAVGSSATQLNDLVGKWFLGADEPTLTSSSYVYNLAAGSLFPHAPTITDEFQGQLGDCYLISSLGTIADSNAAAIENMFVDNGDGTFTVRFYAGTTADYVTVDRMLPTTSSGAFAYADYGANYANAANSLWIPLAEKAYAEWNQTGKEGRDGLNAYGSLESGWMDAVDAQVLGQSATNYSMTSTTEQNAINALAANEAVTIGTSTANYGLVASHAYGITGYDASTGTFTLYNPWGFDQPGPLTWSQLVATCDGFVVAVTSGSVSFGPASVVGEGNEAAATGDGGDGAEAAASSQSSAVAAAIESSCFPEEPSVGDDSPTPVSAVDSVFAAGPSAWDEAVALAV